MTSLALASVVTDDGTAGIQWLCVECLLVTKPRAGSRVLNQAGGLEGALRLLGKQTNQSTVIAQPGQGRERHVHGCLLGGIHHPTRVE